MKIDQIHKILDFYQINESNFKYPRVFINSDRSIVFIRSKDKRKRIKDFLELTLEDMQYLCEWVLK